MRRGKLSAVILGAAVLALAGAASVEAAEFAIDPVHSQVMFKISRFGISNFYGRFNDMSGGFSFDPADASKASFDVTVQAASVDTHAEKRDQHLMSPDFFNAKEMPVIHLKSKSVRKTGDKTYQAVADLSMHGVTKEVTVDIEHIGAGDDPRGAHRSGFEARLVVNRMDFGVSYMPDGLGKEVTVLVSIEGVQK